MNMEHHIPQMVQNHTTETCYLVSKFIGRGDFSRCYKLTNITTGEHVAAKIFTKSPTNCVTPRSHLLKLVNEIKVLRSSEHDNIIRFDSYFEDCINVYVLMEYCPDGSLYDLLMKRKRFDDTEALSLLLGIASGVENLHQRSIIHRDIKLSNILMYHDRPKLSHFGRSSTNKNEGPSGNSHQSLEYRAPEAINFVKTSFPVDLWALGCILYAFKTGRLPFQHKNAEKLIYMIVNGEYETPEFLKDPIKTLIRLLLDLNPKTRETASQLVRKLKMIIKTNNTKKSATTPSTPPRSETISPLQLEWMDDIDAIFTDLTDLLENGSETTVKLTDKEAIKENFKYIVRCFDYSDTCVFGCLLSDGSIILNHSNCHFHLSPETGTVNCYSDHSKESVSYSIYDPRSHHHASRDILVFFSKIFSHYQFRDFKCAYHSAGRSADVPYLVKWKRTGDLFIGMLNNGVVQISFSPNYSLTLTIISWNDKKYMSFVEGGYVENTFEVNLGGLPLEMADKLKQNIPSLRKILIDCKQ